MKSSLDCKKTTTRGGLTHITLNLQTKKKPYINQCFINDIDIPMTSSL